MQADYEAVLVMESRGLANSLRRASIYDPWSRLYRAGDAYYLDLSLTPSRKGALLQCQVLTIDGQTSAAPGRAQLLRNEERVNTQSLEDGACELSVSQAGQYTLEVALEHTTVRVAALDIH